MSRAGDLDRGEAVVMPGEVHLGVRGQMHGSEDLETTQPVALFVGQLDRIGERRVGLHEEPPVDKLSHGPEDTAERPAGLERVRLAVREHSVEDRTGRSKELDETGTLGVDDRHEVARVGPRQHPFVLCETEARA